MTNKFYDMHVLRIGSLFGLIGGALMIYLLVADFGLGYIHGFLFILNYLLVMLVGLAFYKKRANGITSYLKRFSLGILIYCIMSVCSIIYSTYFAEGNPERTMPDKLFVPLIFIAIGLFLSSLLALCFKTAKTNNETI